MSAWRALRAGDKFNLLTVAEDRVRGATHILCRCDCGTEKPVHITDLMRGKTKSCGGKAHLGRKPDPSKKITLRCYICLAQFQTWKARPSRLCSMACRGVAQAIRQSGSASHLWKGGRTTEATRIRSHYMYAEWRRAVMKRDEYTCQSCFRKSSDTPNPRLAAHHIIFFSIEPRLRLKVSNGITLCRQCHRDYHSFHATKEGPKLEGDLVKQAIKFFSGEPGVWMMKVHGGAYQQAGIPDFFGCIAGRAVGIELKVKQNFLAPIQQATGRRIRDAGGAFFAARSLDDIKRIVWAVKEAAIEETA